MESLHICRRPRCFPPAGNCKGYIGTCFERNDAGIRNNGAGVHQITVVLRSFFCYNKYMKFIRINKWDTNERRGRTDESSSIS